MPMPLLPMVLVPGLIASPRYYAAQVPALWRFGPVTIANHTAHDSIGDIARAILADAPPRFALAGHSMGGYIAFEIMRQAPQRVARLALLDTSALPDTPEQTAKRREQIALAQSGRFGEIPDLQFPQFVHADRHDDAALKALMRAMADDNGADVFCRQQQAILGRADSRPTLATIACPTLVLVGDADQPTPPPRSHEIAQGIQRATLVTIAQSGHMTAIERPAEVTAALVAWMTA
jgi:pimeloyl-ACP methyl ester carboxylesterase